MELIRLVEEAKVLAGGKHPCNILGHVWIFSGGSNCGCLGANRDRGDCSIPIYECNSCGDYDYGDNEEAKEIREKCRRKCETYSN